jgi:hypothetical protein
VLQADGASHRNILLDHLLGKTLPGPFGNVAQDPNPAHGPSRDVRAGILFPEEVIDARLGLLGLAATTSLSVLAVEVLPGPLTFPTDLPNINRQPAAVGAQEDPLGANLGLRRILRTSPLAAVPAIC